MTLTHEIYRDLYTAVKNTDEELLSKSYTNPQNLSLIYAVAKNDEKERLYFQLVKIMLIIYLNLKD